MNIALVSDLHLGEKRFRKYDKSINAFEKLGYSQLDKILKILDKEKESIDLFLIAGDIFSKPDPSSLTINKFIQFIESVDKMNIKTFIIGGNHDFSIYNYTNKSHPFSNIELFNNVNFIYEDYKIFEFSDTILACFPHPLVSENKTKVNNIMSEISKDCSGREGTKILLTHGIINSWTDSFPEINKEVVNIYNTVIDDFFIKYFDYIFIGHIHKPIYQKKDGTTIIAPGSPVEEFSGNYIKSNIDIDGCGVVFIDTEKDIIKKDKIDGLKIVKYIANNKEELESCFMEIIEKGRNTIHSIDFDGAWEDIDLSLYYKAIKVSLNLNLSLKNRSVEIKHSSIKDFWNWLDDTYPKYTQEFKNIVREAI